MALLALVVAGLLLLGLALRRSGNTERAVEQGLILAFGEPVRAVAEPAPTLEADRAFVARHRLAPVRGAGRGVVLVRLCAVPGDLSVEEASAIRGAPVAPGTTLSVFVGSPPLGALLLALTRPGFLERAAAVSGVTPARVRAGLRGRGIDLARRTIGGKPWTGLGPGRSDWHALVVGPVAGPPEPFVDVVPLEVARRIEPGAAPGQRWVFPPIEALLPRFFEGLTGARGPVGPGAPGLRAARRGEAGPRLDQRG